MIKRLKWNVLYGDEDGGQETDGSDGSTGSGDSAKIGTEEAQKVLDALAQNDPFLLGTEEQSQDESEGLGGDKGDTHGKPKNESFDKELMEARSDSEDDIQDIQGGEGLQKQAEWRECAICPGRRFLNDEDVQKHLSSGGHLKRAAKANRIAQGQEGTQAAVDNAELMRAEKKKKQTKRRLQALKRRNWEQKQQETTGSGQEANCKDEGSGPNGCAAEDGKGKTSPNSKKRLQLGPRYPRKMLAAGKSKSSNPPKLVTKVRRRRTSAAIDGGSE